MNPDGSDVIQVGPNMTDSVNNFHLVIIDVDNNGGMIKFVCFFVGLFFSRNLDYLCVRV